MLRAALLVHPRAGGCLLVGGGHSGAWRRLSSTAATAAAVRAAPPPPRSLWQRAVADRLPVSSAEAEKRERMDVGLLERLTGLALTLKTCILPARHPLHAISTNVQQKLATRLPSTEAELLSVLDDLTAELTPPAPQPAAPPKLGLFGRIRRSLSFRRSKGAAAAAEAAAASIKPSRFPLSALAAEPTEPALQALLSGLHAELRGYGALSGACQFVPYDAPPRSLSASASGTTAGTGAGTRRPERGYELEWQFGAQAALRVLLLKDYLARLRRAVAEGDLPARRLLGGAALPRLVDAVLLGSASERVLEHMLVCSPEPAAAATAATAAAAAATAATATAAATSATAATASAAAAAGEPSFTPGQLQDAFYLLYEPEVATALTLLAAPAELKPDHRKALAKLSNAYLLDRFELNVKSRCVFAWSDPNYRGFDALDVRLAKPLSVLLEARGAYFEAGLGVGAALANDFTADRRLFYHDKKEFRENVRNGFVFFVIVSSLDWLIRGL